MRSDTTPPHHHTTPRIPRESAAADVGVMERLYAHWVAVHRAAYRVAKRPSATRRKAMLRALAEFGFSEETLMLAIDGCKASRWCQGGNKAGAVFDDLAWILHRETRIERLASEGKDARALHQAQLDAVNGPREPSTPSPMPEEVRARLVAQRAFFERRAQR